MNCRVCGASLRAHFRHELLGKYDVQYFSCAQCGLLQTEAPYWLEEAYGSAIATRDTGLVWRNLQLASIATCLLWQLHGAEARCLDAAGGYGLFTRLMRDIGFDCYWWDPHASNLLARGFEGNPESGSYHAITAFEVLEHLTDPVGFLNGLRTSTGCSTFITSTETFAGEPPAPDAWWYYAFDTGQHISFYQRSTLEAIAQRLGLRLYSNRNVHVWTDQRLSALQFRLMTHPRWSRRLSAWPRSRLRSRIWADSELLARRPA
jgi:hypothetical protein